jgi:hypothetical protein
MASRGGTGLQNRRLQVRVLGAPLRQPEGLFPKALHNRTSNAAVLSSLPLRRERRNRECPGAGSSHDRKSIARRASEPTSSALRLRLADLGFVFRRRKGRELRADRAVWPAKASADKAVSLVTSAAVSSPQAPNDTAKPVPGGEGPPQGADFEREAQGVEDRSIRPQGPFDAASGAAEGGRPADKRRASRFCPACCRGLATGLRLASCVFSARAKRAHGHHRPPERHRRAGAGVQRRQPRADSHAGSGSRVQIRRRQQGSHPR